MLLVGVAVAADAADRSNGGVIEIAATGKASIDGSLTANDSAKSQAGTVRVLARGHLSVRPDAVLSAPSGTTGTVLFDPTDLDIQSAIYVIGGSGQATAGTASTINGIIKSGAIAIEATSAAVASFTSSTGNEAEFPATTLIPGGLIGGNVAAATGDATATVAVGSGAQITTAATAHLGASLGSTSAPVGNVVVRI